MLLVLTSSGCCSMTTIVKKLTSMEPCQNAYVHSLLVLDIQFDYTCFCLTVLPA